MAAERVKAYKPASWQGRTIRHEDFAANLVERREAQGQPELPRNAGTRRTKSKRAMLKALDDLGS